MAAAAIGLTLVGGVMQAQAARQQAKDREVMGKYKAELAKRDAANVRMSAAEQQKIRRTEMRKTLARNREITASSGLMMTGTPAAQQLDVIDNFG